MGLDIWWEGKEKNSSKYPAHLWKKNYLRSSYNSSGFNFIIRTLLGKDLYWVFDYKEENNKEYGFHPNWKVVKKRAEQLLKEIKRIKLPYKVETVNINLSQKVSEIDALHIVKTEFLKRIKCESFNYSRPEGIFYFKKPLNVVAVIPGIDFSNNPCVHLVYRLSDEEWEWYVQAAEILQEFVEEASKKDAIIYWSA